MTTLFPLLASLLSPPEEWDPGTMELLSCMSHRRFKVRSSAAIMILGANWKWGVLRDRSTWLLKHQQWRTNHNQSQLVVHFSYNPCLIFISPHYHYHQLPLSLSSPSNITLISRLYRSDPALEITTIAEKELLQSCQNRWQPFIYTQHDCQDVSNSDNRHIILMQISYCVSIVKCLTPYRSYLDGAFHQYVMFNKKTSKTALKSKIFSVVHCIFFHRPFDNMEIWSGIRAACRGECQCGICRNLIWMTVQAYLHFHETILCVQLFHLWHCLAQVQVQKRALCPLHIPRTLTSQGGLWHVRN